MTGQFEALQLRFLERCTDDLGVLQRWLNAAADVSPTELKGLIHQISGSAGAFGFPHLSALAMRLDNSLWAGMTPAREDMNALIDELRAITIK
jgi:HPt (histidine-containing phosphotransfer) domain-containing protein